MQANQIADRDRYDRQLRVWGVDAQKKLQNAKVLLINLQGIAPEIAKNLVLAGVNIGINEGKKADEFDLSMNFFLHPEDLNKPVLEYSLPHIHELNNNVEILTSFSYTELTDDYLNKFDVFVLSNGTLNQALQLNSFARKNNKGFFWSLTYGDEACFYSDFGANFEYNEDPSTNTTENAPATTEKNEPKIIHFPSLEEVFNTPYNKFITRHFPLNPTYVRSRLLIEFFNQYNRRPSTSSDVELVEKILNDFINKENLTSLNENNQKILLEIKENLNNFVLNSSYGFIFSVSILGSFLSQEIIKYISHKGKPSENFILYASDPIQVRGIPLGYH